MTWFDLFHYLFRGLREHRSKPRAGGEDQAAVWLKGIGTVSIVLLVGKQLRSRSRHQILLTPWKDMTQGLVSFESSRQILKSLTRRCLMVMTVEGWCPGAFGGCVVWYWPALRVRQ